MRAAPAREFGKGPVPQLRELLDAQRNRKSEQLSKENWLYSRRSGKPTAIRKKDAEQEPDEPEEPQAKKRSGRQPLAKDLIREWIVHDLPEAVKHCDCCGKDLRLIVQETSERYEYIPASVKVIEDVRKKYACGCTVKTADKPAQPIEKSTAGASMPAHQVIGTDDTGVKVLDATAVCADRADLAVSRRRAPSGGGPGLHADARPRWSSKVSERI